MKRRKDGQPRKVPTPKNKRFVIRFLYPPGKTRRWRRASLSPKPSVDEVIQQLEKWFPYRNHIPVQIIALQLDLPHTMAKSYRKKKYIPKNQQKKQ